MRTIEINGREFEVHGLKRKEVKVLKKEGYVLASLDHKSADDCMDRAFEMVFTDDQLEAIDEIQNADAIKLWQAMLLETYGVVPENEKKTS
jgi:hypothetical protein